MGLDVLEGGGSLTSGNGLLTFDNFDVVTTGSVRSNLALYDVQALADGIAITGPIAAAGGSAGDLFVQFNVSSNSPISGAALRFNGAAAGAGSSASVTESFEENDGQLFVFATGAGTADRSDSLTFSPGVTELRVSKDILVDSGAPRPGNDVHPVDGQTDGAAPGGIAVISRIEQHFTAPEPAALLLLGSALAGLALVRRRVA